MNRLQIDLIAVLLLCTSFWLPGMQRDAANKITRAPIIRTHTVEIKQMSFSPVNIVVQKGDRIIFVNHDLVTHDITEAKKAWGSPALPVGKSWSVTVTRSTAYYCSIHPVMKGKITVK